MEVSSQHYALATLLQENKCSTHRTEGWVGPRARLAFESSSLRTDYVGDEKSIVFR